MSAPVAPNSGRNERPRLLRGQRVLEVLAVGCLLLACCCVAPGFLQAPFYLLFGWAFYLAGALEGVGLGWPALLVLVSLGCFVALVGLVHLVRRWWSGRDARPRLAV